MKRSDCDLRLKDREGLTPFDLFNATVEGTNPEPKHASRSELYTWGNNRNFNLGVNADGDRSLPESVKVRPQSNAKWSLQPISARSVQMDKFHTAVITNESSANLRLCGFGSTGRMGAGGLKITLEPLPELRQSLAQVALGMDHTVLLTKEGDVFTFGQV